MRTGNVFSTGNAFLDFFFSVRNHGKITDLLLARCVVHSMLTSPLSGQGLSGKQHNPVVNITRRKGPTVLAVLHAYRRGEAARARVWRDREREREREGSGGSARSPPQGRLREAAPFLATRGRTVGSGQHESSHKCVFREGLRAEALLSFIHARASQPAFQSTSSGQSRTASERLPRGK
jgi:hypothetical protein